MHKTLRTSVTINSSKERYQLQGILRAMMDVYRQLGEITNDGLRFDGDSD